MRTKLGKVAGLEVIARGSSLEYRHTTKRPTRDRPRAGRRLPADRDRALGEVGRHEPGAGDARAGGRAAGPGGPLALGRAVRRVAHRRVPGPGRHRDQGGRRARRGARRQHPARAHGQADREPGRLRRVPEGRGGVAGDERDRSRRASGGRSASTSARSRSTRPSRSPGRGSPTPARASTATASRTPRSASRRGSPRSAPAGSSRTSPWSTAPSGAYYATVEPDRPRSRGSRSTSRASGLPPTTSACSGRSRRRRRVLGRWDSAAARLARAALLDPRSASVASQLADVLTLLRQYAAADSAADRALALAPTNLDASWQKVLVTWRQGDLDSARAVIRAAARQIDPASALAPTSRPIRISTGCWTTQQQRQVLASPLSAFDDDRANWGIVLAQLYHLRGDRGRAAVYADSARIAFAEQSRAAPEDAQRHVVPRARPGLPGAEGGRGAGGPAGGGAAADQPGRQ